MSDSTVSAFRGALPLLEREIIRFYRQRNRIVGAALQPLVFWLLLGFGLRGSFQGDSITSDYFQYAYPGIVVLSLLFTAIFATISIIEDRQQGFLQGVLVAPLPRLGIVLGKVLGAATIACFQGVLYLALAPFAGIDLTVAQALLGLLVIVPISIALASLGFVLAWRLDSTQGFHAIMNVLLIPMWLLSGAFFPATGAPAALVWVMQVNPLSYGLRAFRDAVTGRVGTGASESFVFDLSVTLAFALATTALAVIASRRTEER